MRAYLVLLLSVLLAACGFQLRGAHLEALQESAVYVQSNGADSLATEVRRQLGYAGVKMAGSAKEAEYVISLSDESFTRRVLSVSPDTGKVEEYAISYQALVSITGANGEALLKSEPVAAVRDYTFDEAAVLGKFEEENVLRGDIAKHAAASVLRRFEAVIR